MLKMNRLFKIFILTLLLALSVIVAQEEGTGQEEEQVHQQYDEAVEIDATGEIHEHIQQQPVVDCDPICAEKVVAAVSPINEEKAVLHSEIDELKREIGHSRELLENSKRELDDQLAEKQELLKNIEQLRKSLDQTRADFLKVEGEAKEKTDTLELLRKEIQAGTGKILNLEKELDDANEQIKELSSISFVKQLQKELQTLWTALQQYWTTVRDKLSKKD